MIIEETLEPIEMEDIYSTLPLEAIPWNVETPPKTLVELVKSEKVKPCKTIDLGCGIGYYAIYLANMGFDVTGIDISPTASSEEELKGLFSAYFKIIEVKNPAA